MGYGLWSGFASFAITIVIVVVSMRGPLWLFWKVGPLEKPHREAIDSRKINEAELELGLGLSDYGTATTDVIVGASSGVIRENQRVIDKLDETLNPIDDIAKRIAAVYAVPGHLMGGCPRCGQGAWNEQGRCTVCAWNMLPRAQELRQMIQPMDCLYPVEIIRPPSG